MDKHKHVLYFGDFGQYKRYPFYLKDQLLGGKMLVGGSGGGGIGAWGSFPPLTYPGLTNRLLWVLPRPFRVASHSETPK